jgi:S-methylmethionine-dependent homocysteine/selenocysteine methylase
MSEAWLEKLAAGGTLVIDGGTGSELARRGMPLRHNDVWSGLAALTHPQLLREVHADYIAVGADVITTNTFGTSRFVLDAAGFGDRFEEINRAAVEAALAARDASGADVAIAGSISCLPPRFDAAAYPDAATEKAAYRELVETLIGRGADFIALEMMQEPAHGALAGAAVAEAGIPFWLGVSCNIAAPGGGLVGFDYADVPLAETLDALLPYGPAVVCAMHSPLAAIAPALGAIRACTDRPIGAYPEIDARATTPAAFAALAVDWHGFGARVLGGCCGTTPEHIRALRAAVVDA